MPPAADLPVRRLEAAAYTIPTEAPEGDGTLAWDSTTLVVVEATAGAVTGLGYTYADRACVPLITGKLAPVVCGLDAPDVPAAWEAMRREVRNLGRPGLVSCALSAVETALWDLAARLANLPLCRLLGRARRDVPVYGSGGFTTFDDDQLRAQLHGWLDAGIPRVKIKIGESWGTAVDRDLARTAFARKEVGDTTELYVDANGGYRVGQAVRVGRVMEEYDVRWFEEPVSSDDLPGLRRVRDALDLDVTAGEYGFDLVYFARMLDAGAVDCLQIDATRCGGYSEWLRAAALAAARNLDVSGHCAPNLTAHVAAATPNFRHLEWFADHDRIERMLFDGTLDPTGGAVHPDLTITGHGLRLRRSDAERHRVA
jgi:L-alanine-DL-glutamate epimerase-like enolase superfamily enzyme